MIDINSFQLSTDQIDQTVMSVNYITPMTIIKRVLP